MSKQTSLAVVSGHAQRASRKASRSEFDATMDHQLNRSVASAVKRGYAMVTKRQKHGAMGLAVLLLFAWYVVAQAQSRETSKTQIVLLGTGTPAMDPEHSGPSTAIVVKHLSDQNFDHGGLTFQIQLKTCHNINSPGQDLPVMLFSSIIYGSQEKRWDTTDNHC
jgi:hypothetical protein